MAWTLPTIKVQIAFGKGPSDTLLEGDWTDVSSWVRGYRDRRGRDDVLVPFQPGTCAIVLDNKDRTFDPSNSGGLVYGDDGLPLCPVKVTLDYKGDEYPKFYGFLGPEVWAVDPAPHGPESTVTVTAIDALGCSPGLPGDIWGIITKSLRPDWWLRMDVSFVLDVSSPVYDAVTTGWAEIQGTTGISRPYWSTSSYAEVGTFSPGLLVSGDHELVSYALDIMPDGDESDFTMWMWWSARTQMTTGQSAVVARMYAPGGGDYRWDVVVDGDDGLAYVTTYDAGGTPIDTATISPIASSRWDEGDKHQIIARYSGGSLTVWFGGVSETLTGTSVLYESDLSCGPASVDVMIDEVTVWRRALSVTTEIEPVMAAGGYGTLWAGDTIMDRFGRWVEASGRDVGYDDTNQWHVADSTTQGFWGLLRPLARKLDSGLSSVVARIPATIADAFQQTVESVGGARWVTKDGWMRARDRLALTDSSYAEHYATPVLFTDADATLSSDEFRHAGVEVTGKRPDRIVNRATIEFYPSGPPPTGSSYEPMRITKRDQPSIRRYGEHPWELNSDWADWTVLSGIIEDLVDQFAEPRQEVEVLHLDPLNDEALTDWLVQTCELEQACDVTFSARRYGTTPLVTNLTGLNIQQIEWDWTPTRLLVDLMVAKS